MAMGGARIESFRVDLQRVEAPAPPVRQDSREGSPQGRVEGLCSGLKGATVSGGPLSSSAAPEALAGMRAQPERDYNQVGCCGVPSPTLGNVKASQKTARVKDGHRGPQGRDREAPQVTLPRPKPSRGFGPAGARV
jgi:hypothetical protein